MLAGHTRAFAFFCVEDSAAYELHVQTSFLRPAFCFLFNGLGRLRGQHVSEPVQTPFYPLGNYPAELRAKRSFCYAQGKKAARGVCRNWRKVCPEKPRREFAITPLVAARRAWVQRALVCLMDGPMSPRPRGKARRKLSTNDAHTGLAPQRCPICRSFPG